MFLRHVSQSRIPLTRIGSNSKTVSNFITKKKSRYFNPSSNSTHYQILLPSSISQSRQYHEMDQDIGARYDSLRLGSDGSLTNISISKSEILSKYQIHMRDLLQLGNKT